MVAQGSAGALSEHVRRIIVEHHERIDGSGFPQGLSGDVISIADTARIKTTTVIIRSNTRNWVEARRADKLSLAVRSRRLISISRRTASVLTISQAMLPIIHK